MKLTDEVRRAVAAEQCESLGHDFDQSTAITATGQRPDGTGTVVALNTRGDRCPHLLCLRCERVWLIVETGAVDYATAEHDLIERLRPDDALAGKLADRRALRNAPVQGPEPPPPGDPTPVAEEHGHEHEEPDEQPTEAS